MKKSLIILALVSSLGGFLFANSQLSYAEETTTTSDSAEDLLCAKNVATSASSALDDYLSFLDQYFKIDKPTSEQIEDGITRYRYYINEVKDGFDLASTPVAHKAISGNVESYAYCSYVEKQYLEFGKKMLTVFAINSAASKPTYKVVDGLKAINEKMSDFSQEFNTVFPQLFQKMDNALPCYAKSCTTK